MDTKESFRGAHDGTLLCFMRQDKINNIWYAFVFSCGTVLIGDSELSEY